MQIINAVSNKLKRNSTFIKANNTLDSVTGVTNNSILIMFMARSLTSNIYKKQQTKSQDLTLAIIYNIGNKTYASFRNKQVNRAFPITQSDE